MNPRVKSATTTTLIVAWKLWPILGKIWESRKGDSTANATRGMPPPDSHTRPVEDSDFLVVNKRRYCCKERYLKYCFVNNVSEMTATAAEMP